MRALWSKLSEAGMFSREPYNFWIWLKTSWILPPNGSGLLKLPLALTNSVRTDAICAAAAVSCWFIVAVSSLEKSKTVAPRMSW